MERQSGVSPLSVTFLHGKMWNGLVCFFSLLCEPSLQLCSSGKRRVQWPAAVRGPRHALKCGPWGRLGSLSVTPPAPAASACPTLLPSLLLPCEVGSCCEALQCGGYCCCVPGYLPQPASPIAGGSQIRLSFSFCRRPSGGSAHPGISWERSHRPERVWSWAVGRRARSFPSAQRWPPSVLPPQFIGQN